MKIDLVTTAHSLPESTKKLIESAYATCNGHSLAIHLFLHSSIVETVLMCEELDREYDSIYLYNYRTNRGLSRSWNDGIEVAYGTGADVVVISNDDVEFVNNGLTILAEAAVEHRECHIVTCGGFHTDSGEVIESHGYSCFAINPIAIEKIGYFDENFFPIYLEDCDYAYRAKLAGLEEYGLGGNLIVHGGSMSINSNRELFEQNLVTQTTNGVYYRKKWGGIDKDEMFKHPFDDSAFSFIIRAEDRSFPYPGHNRTDHNIVKV